MAKGFWQIRIADGDRQKTAFTTPFGLYEFTRLPFGLNSAPGVFQATMTRVLSDLLWTICVVYIDDILIYSDTWEEHLEAIDKVLQRLIQANLKIKLSKCEFARTQLQYLGHIINSQGIATDPKKVEAIRLWAPPKTVKENWNSSSELLITMPNLSPTLVIWHLPCSNSRRRELNGNSQKNAF